ncbi:MAG: AtpZ/AtpI family protein [Candidatus Binataceae bacterium]|jgi:F0F1-type ATP synthase assembly protein I
MAVDVGKMARYGAIGIEFSSPIVAGAIIGHYLDQYFRTDPWLTLVVFLTGVVIAFYRLIVTLSEMQKEQ